METFAEMIAQRQKESDEFYARYNTPKKLAAVLDSAIEALETAGYKVETYEHSECGTAYEILYSDNSPVYGFGTCDEETIVRAASTLRKNITDEEKNDKVTEAAPLYGANAEKEMEYDDTYNEGGEGYNPYRIGSKPTYKWR